MHIRLCLNSSRSVPDDSHSDGINDEEKSLVSLTSKNKTDRRIKRNHSEVVLTVLNLIHLDLEETRRATFCVCRATASTVPKHKKRSCAGLLLHRNLAFRYLVIITVVLLKHLGNHIYLW